MTAVARRSLPLLLAALLAAAPAGAATLTAQAAATGFAPPASAFDIDFVRDTAAEARRTATAAARQPFRPGEGRGDAAVDARTGALSAAAAQTGLGSTYAEIGPLHRLHRHRDRPGPLRPRHPRRLESRPRRHLGLGLRHLLARPPAPGGTRHDEFSLTSDDPTLPASGDRGHRLGFTAQIRAGESYALTARIVTYLESAVGGSLVDAGRLFYVASGGAALAFDDPEVLAAPIPLPPGGLLLAARRSGTSPSCVFARAATSPDGSGRAGTGRGRGAALPPEDRRAEEGDN